MNKTKVVIPLLLLLCASVCFAADIDGKWVGKMQGPNGESEIAFTFKVVGDSLSGFVGSPMGDMPVSHSKINGNEFSFDVAMGDMTIGHQCTLEGDTVKMKVTGFPEPMELVLRRVAADK